MGRLIAIALLISGCGYRPLAGPCASGVDCEADEWCVMAWDRGHPGVTAWEETGGICAAGCASDAECGDGKCVAIGDGVTTMERPPFFACEP